MNTTHSDKVIAITGASSGIGKATAVHFAARGWNVVLAARGQDRLDAVRAEIESQGGSVDALAVDVSKFDSMRGLIELAVHRFGRLDVMVSNAGSMPLAPLEDLDTEGWERMIDVNIKGVLWAIAAALPVFKAQDKGHFVTIGSTAALRMNPSLAVYGGTKAAVNAIMEGLRQEMAGRFRVTTIHPGYTDTDFAAHITNDAMRQHFAGTGKGMAMDPAAVAHAIAHAVEQPGNVNIGEIVIRPTAQA